MDCAYSLLATDQPTLIYGDAGIGGPASVISRPFGGLTSASDGVVNVAVGGHFRPLRERNLRVHGGFATSRSPVSLLNGRPLLTKFDVHTGRLIYSLAYQF